MRSISIISLIFAKTCCDIYVSGRILPPYLSSLMAIMVAKNLAVYEPSKQTRAVLLYWRLPEEWADVLHSWVSTSFNLKLNDLSSHTGNGDWPAQYHPHFL